MSQDINDVVKSNMFASSCPVAVQSSTTNQGLEVQVLVKPCTRRAMMASAINPIFFLRHPSEPYRSDSMHGIYVAM